MLVSRIEVQQTGPGSCSLASPAFWRPSYFLNEKHTFSRVWPCQVQDPSWGRKRGQSLTAKAAPLLSSTGSKPASRAVQMGPAQWGQGLWIWGEAGETGLLWRRPALSPGAFLLGGRRSGGFLQKPTPELGSGAQMSRTPASKETSFEESCFSHCSLFLGWLLFLTLFSASPLWCPPKQGLTLLLLSPLSQLPPPGGPVPLVPPEQHSPFGSHLLLSLLGPGLVWERTVLGVKCQDLILQELLPRLRAAPLPGVKTFRDLSQTLLPLKLPSTPSERSQPTRRGNTWANSCPIKIYSLSHRYHFNCFMAKL